MKLVIKIIFFKILFIIFLTTNLNSTPVILLQTDTQLPKVNINVKIPTLVLREIISQFSGLEMIDDSNFYNNPKWSILKEWDRESASQLYILKILTKSESSSLGKVELVIYIYKYRLESNNKFSYYDAIKLMVKNPHIKPLIIEFLFIGTGGAKLDEILSESFIRIKNLKTAIMKVSHSIQVLHTTTRGTIYYEILYNELYHYFYDLFWKEAINYTQMLTKDKEELIEYQKNIELNNVTRERLLKKRIKEIKKILELPWKKYLYISKKLLNIMSPTNILDSNSLMDLEELIEIKIEEDEKYMGIPRVTDYSSEDENEEMTTLTLPNRVEEGNINSLENELSNMQIHLDN